MNSHTFPLFPKGSRASTGSKANKSVKRRRRVAEKPNKRANAEFIEAHDSEDDVVFDTASDSDDVVESDATDATETGAILTNLIKVEVSKVFECYLVNPRPFLSHPNQVCGTSFN